MLCGARRVGKTYILKEFGRNEFEDMVYIDCRGNPDVKRLFAQDKDTGRILLGLSALSRRKIGENGTLVFLDEAQEVPDVVAALKYFCEDAPGIAVAVAVAGSSPAAACPEGISFPTGKTDIVRMYPLTFGEFLGALGEEKMKILLNDPGQRDLVNCLLPEYTELLRRYFFVGGMPEAAAEFAGNRFPEAVRRIQEDILAGYEADIAKHAGRDAPKALRALRSIPDQLARANKKFTYGALKKGARAAAYESAVQRLADAGLVYKAPRLAEVGLPLKPRADGDAFKLFFLDTGLLGALAGIPPAEMLIGDGAFSAGNGMFAENFALTETTGVPGTFAGYYAKRNSTLKIDLVIQAGGSLLPVEVRAEENPKAKSLRRFVAAGGAGSGLRGIRFSLKGFERRDWMTNVPLFAARAFIENLVSADAEAAAARLGAGRRR